MVILKMRPKLAIQHKQYLNNMEAVSSSHVRKKILRHVNWFLYDNGLRHESVISKNTREVKKT